MHSLVHLQIIWLLLFHLTKQLSCHKSFVIHFQPRSNGSMYPTTDEWIEFTNEIPHSKEFTACLWLKTNYYNQNIPFTLWSYCTAESADDEMRCLELHLMASSKSANRNVRIAAWIPSNGQVIKVAKEVKKFLHRKWIHFCWSFSSITRQNRFYYNGQFLGSDTVLVHKNVSIMKSSKQMFDSAFIFGQEQDVIRGDFDRFQSFIGDLAELNIWSYLQNDTKIMNMAMCKDWERGNVLSWEKSNMKMHNVVIDDIKNAISLCFEERRFVIFPERVTFSEAKEICATHGGSIAVPRSEDESTLMLKIADEHREQCNVNEKRHDRKALWIGARKVNHMWYEMNSDDSIGIQINYTKWHQNYNHCPDLNCAFLQNDGVLGEGFDYTCTFKETLCTICAITDTPLFTIKGNCWKSDIDWNFYMVIDDLNQIRYFDGYKDTIISPSNGYQNWKISPKDDQDRSFVAKILPNNHSRNFPIGRHNWFVKDRRCKYDQSVITMTLSQCDFGTQFTCDSGDCVDLSKRCDGVEDCPDDSDEQLCYLVDIPTSYRIDDPPRPTDQSTALQLLTKLDIISIDSIDTVNMIVTITSEIHLKWHDKRLSFLNLFKNRENVVSEAKVSRIWIPLDHLIIENSIIGEIKYDKQRVKIHPSSSQNAIDSAYENHRYNGSKNLLSVSKRMKSKYNCKFNVRKFPFDEETCYLLFKIDHYKKTRLTFVEDGPSPIAYIGPGIVDQFEIGSMLIKINTTQQHTRLTLAIPFKRIFTHQLLQTFFPTFILWLLGYSTIFVDIERPDSRLMASLTIMLVLATLLSVINVDLPKTSYIKLINVWVVWHIVIMFVMIIYHIWLDIMRTLTLPTNIKRVNPQSNEPRNDNDSSHIKNSTDAIKKINRIMTILFPILNCTFYVMYFFLTIN